MAVFLCNEKVRMMGVNYSIKIPIRDKNSEFDDPNIQLATYPNFIETISLVGEKEVVSVVCDAYKVSLLQIFSSSRGKFKIAEARQVAMYLVHTLFGKSMNEVAVFFNRDRTTISHACVKIEEMRDGVEFDQMVECLEEKLINLLKKGTNNVS